MGYGLSGRAGGSASNACHAAYWRGHSLPPKGCTRCFYLDRHRGGSGKWSASPEWSAKGGCPLFDRDGRRCRTWTCAGPACYHGTSVVHSLLSPPPAASGRWAGSVSHPSRFFVRYIVSPPVLTPF